MFKSQCLFLCLSYVFVGSYGNLVPFIDKCEWNDQACLVASTIKALPYFAKGLPDLGIPPMDPLNMNTVTISEGDLKLVFKDMIVTGESKCKILKIERDISKQLLKIEAECPIDVAGNYEASGKVLFAPIEGNGPFQVNCKLIYISVDVQLGTVLGEDGAMHWNIDKATHTYDATEKVTFHFDNLFNGDQEKAGPILRIFNESWKDIMLSVGKPIVDEVVGEIVRMFQIFCTKVPADQLEK